MARPARRKIAFLFFAMLAGALSAGAAEIEFKASAIVTQSIVSLGDVAKVTGSNATELSQLELFPAPSGNESRIVRASFVRQQLELHGISFRENQFTGATMIRIARSRNEAQPTSNSRSPSTPIPTPADERPRLAFAKRVIPQGQTIQLEDVELRTVDQLPAGVAGFTTLEAAIGQEATRTIGTDQPIDGRSLRRPVLVSRGQTITVIARATGVRAKTTAKALADGARGDTILVESLDTKHKYAVIVTDHQQVETMSRAFSTPSSSLRMAARDEQK